MTLFCDFLGAGFTTSKGTVDFNYRYGSYAPRRLVLVPGTDSARMVVGELRNVCVRLVVPGSTFVLAKGVLTPGTTPITLRVLCYALLCTDVPVVLRTSCSYTCTMTMSITYARILVLGFVPVIIVLPVHASAHRILTKGYAATRPQHPLSHHRL
eukprot:3940720-Rhodomonas_salina.1